MIKNLFAIFLTFLTINSQASIKVLKKRGKVYYSIPKEGGRTKYKQLKDQNVLPKKTIIKTQMKSYIKLRVDKTSIITIGPNSISKVSKLNNQPTFLSLIKGKVRAKVDKHASPYKGHKHKLYLKTKTASVGVRGTELILVANEKNFITSLVTLRGTVHARQRPTREVNEGIRSNYELHKEDHKGSVMTFSRDFEHDVKEEVSAGHLISTHIGTDETAKKVKISPTQFKLLKKNQTFTTKKPSKTIYHKGSGTFTMPQNDNLSPTPIGSNKEEFEHNPHGLPGGKLDLKTALYISPPEGSNFDKKSKTYHFPKEFGGVNSETGEYVPPKGTELHPTKGFIAKLGQEIGKLKLIRDKLNRKIENKIFRFSEITNLSLNANFQYLYDTNVFENLYDLPKGITNTDSMKIKMNGTLAHETFSNRRYLYRPRLLGSYTHHNRAKDALVKRNNEGRVGAAMEFRRKHKAFYLPAYFLTDVQYSTIYKDFRNKNQIDHYAKELKIIMSENFSLHRKYFSNLGLRFTKFTLKEEIKSGDYLQAFFHQEANLGRRFNVSYFFDYGKRALGNSDEIVYVYKNKVNFLAKKLFRKTYFQAGLELSYFDFKDSLSKNFEKLGSSVKLVRKKGPFTEYFLSHEFNKFNSINPSQKFKQNLFSIGASLHF